MSDPAVKIYVGGPVVDRLDAKTAHGNVYRQLQTALGTHNAHVVMPLHKSALDKLSARDFYSFIDKAIQDADGIIVVLAPGDQSSPVEATTAALKGKPQTIIALGEKVPRLLAGLPEVVEAIKIDRANLEKQMEGVAEKLVDAIRPAAMIAY